MVIFLRTIKSVEERRQEILDGAMKLFSEKGYDKTSISDIATYLGISQGLCYRYFKLKEEIFEIVIDEYSKTIDDEMIKVITSSDLTIQEKIGSQSNFNDLEKKSLYYEVFHGENTKLLHDCMSMSICRKLTPYVQAEIDKEIEKGKLKVSDSAMIFCNSVSMILTRCTASIVGYSGIIISVGLLIGNLEFLGLRKVFVVNRIFSSLGGIWLLLLGISLL